MPSGGGYGGGGGHFGGGGFGGGGGGFGGGFGGNGGGFRGGFGGRPGGCGGPFFGFFPFPCFWGGWGMGPRRSGCGCLPAIIIFVLIAVLLTFSVLNGATSKTEASITPSTIDRAPMDDDFCKKTDSYYTDNIGVVEQSSVMIQGLKKFYEATGVQPYIYFTDNLGNRQDIEDFAYDTYLDLFNKDEGHLLLVFYQKYNDEWQLMIGDNAVKYVMDAEAQKILLDYVEYYYHNGESYSDGFNKAFSDAAARIMGGKTQRGLKSLSTNTLIGIGAGIVILVIIIIAVSKKKRRYEDDGTYHPGGNNNSSDFSGY